MLERLSSSKKLFLFLAVAILEAKLSLGLIYYELFHEDRKGNGAVPPS
jgi:hypothetical protein